MLLGGRFQHGMDNMGYEHMTGGVLQEYQYPQAFELESPSEGTTFVLNRSSICDHSHRNYQYGR